jgi:mevalonate kinase
MKRFPAKVLLFGEYAVLEGSEALAGPLHEFYGQWSVGSTDLDVPEVDFKALHEHIEKLIDNRILTFHIDEMKNDYKEGWRFSTNIPVGYGLGSSGAFTAALYEKYGEGDYAKMAPNKVKRHMALIESFFHGESSGIDPTISIHDKAIRTGYEWKFVDGNIFEPIKDNGLRFFLFDSGTERSSKSLIAHFKTQTTSPKFRNEVLEPLVHTNRNAIEATLKGDPSLWQHFEEISKIQFSHFEPMIVDNVLNIWADSFSDDVPYLLKVCGAGGGGYYLGLTTDIDQTMRTLGIDKVIML